MEVPKCVQQPSFSNGKLWLALGGVVSLQVVVVHWDVAQPVFDTTDLRLEDWGLAAVIASSTLFLEEGRKLLLKLLRYTLQKPRSGRG